VNIVIGADHRGFASKERLKLHLLNAGHQVADVGTDSPKSCDYPDAAYEAARRVASRDADLGVLLCGSGIGMSIAANKVPGIRAALCHDELTVEMARRHNNANILCLPADLIGEALMQRMLDVWLKTPFEGGRHERRVEKIAEIEARKPPSTEAKT
jgi:ribose 5-phosphate isomerase B